MTWKKHGGNDLIDQNLLGKGNVLHDAKKCNLYRRIISIGVEIGVPTEELIGLTKETIKRLLTRQCYVALEAGDNRSSNEAKLTKELTMANLKRKREPDEPKYSRRKNCRYGQARLGTLNLNDFAARLGSKKSPLCPNSGCSARETRGHFLFYCPKSKDIRNKFFSARKVNYKARQITILSENKFKGAVIGFSNEAFASRATR